MGQILFVHSLVFIDTAFLHVCISMLKPITRKRKIVIIVCSVLLFLLAAVFVFFTFYLDDALTATAIPRMQKIIRIVTHGRFELKIAKITHSGDDIFAHSFELIRQHYDTSETGITIECLSVDTVRCFGVHWWDLIRGEELEMSMMLVNAPRLYLTDASKQHRAPDTIHDTIKIPPLIVGNFVLNDINIFLPDKSKKEPTFRGLDIKLAEFSMDPEHSKNISLINAKHASFSLPKADYILPADPFYMVHVQNMRGNSDDSSLSVESLSYTPRFSEDAFAAKHTYATASVSMRASNIKVSGIHLTKLFGGESIEFKSIRAGSWSVSSYLDRRRPANPHPPPAVLPNQMIHTLPIPLNIGSVILANGKLIVRERSAKSGAVGMLYFDRVNLQISPLSTDGPNADKPTVMNASGYFVGQGLLRSTWIYPLKHKSLDMDIHATVSGFDAKRLNTWLVPFERTQINDGELINGTIEMKIRNGISTTTVTPRYRNLSMKLLPQDTTKTSGIKEGIMSFFAKTFVLRKENLDQSGKPALSATTTKQRARDEELMQFVWLSLRQSLGQIVGGFK
jgi:hypothetical protein